MKLKWYGHSCFGMTFADGTVLITDPFDPPTGYPLCTARADIVTVSHGHHDHDYTQSLTGDFLKLDTAEEKQIGNVHISWVECFHDEDEGTKRGKNRIAVIEADGLKIVHMGDVGHRLSEEQIAPLKDADLLLIPIGGFYTIDTDMAVETIRRIAPKTAAAMHYSNEWCRFNISDEKRFEQLTDAVRVPNEVELSEYIRLPEAIIMAYEA